MRPYLAKKKLKKDLQLEWQSLFCCCGLRIKHRAVSFEVWPVFKTLLYVILYVVMNVGKRSRG